MSLSFTTPILLSLLLLLVPLARIWLTHPNSLTPHRRSTALGLRCLTVTCLVLALAGAQLVTKTDNVTVLFLMDRSLSTGGDSQQWQRDYVSRALEGKKQEDRYGIVLFGKDSRVELSPAAHQQASIEPFTVVVDRTATGLTSALRFAASVFPGDTAGRLVVLSDGQSTEAESAEEASSIAAAGIEVWSVPLPDPGLKDVLIARFEGPSQLAINEPFVLRTVVESAGIREAELTLSENGHPIERLRVKLQDGPNLFLLPQRRQQAGAVRYEVRVAASGDQRPENNKGEVLLLVGEQQSVWVLRSEPGPGSLLPLLTRAGLRARALTPSELPLRAGAWRDVSALVIEDVSALDWPLEIQSLVSVLVRDGGMGLVMLGSDSTFGVGGYQRTPLEPLLPLNLAVRRPKDMPLAALMQCLDKSGSMSGHPIEMAREAAIAASSTLSERDLAGLIAFDESSRWVVRLQPKGDGSYFEKRVASLRAGGGTDLYPGLERSLEALEGVTAPLKHIIVLSDGATAPADFDALMTRARQNRITVSAVALGQGADLTFLEDLTQKGKGRLYVSPDTQQGSPLPQIFIREALLATGSGVWEKPTEIRPNESSAASPLLQGLNFIKAPPLAAFNLASAKGGTSSILLQSPKGDPILAIGRAGLGKTAAWTSDLGGSWASSWATHPGAGGASLLETLLLRTIRSVNTVGDLNDRSRGNHLEAQAATLGDLSSITLRLKTSQPLSGPVKAVVVNGRGEAIETVMQPESPFVATGAVQVSSAGSSLILAQDSQGQLLGRAHLSIPLAPEFAKLGTDEELLKELARRSHGRFDPPASELFLPPAHPFPIRTALGHTLIKVAILLLLLEIAVRRLPLPRRGKANTAVATPAGISTTESLKQQLSSLRQARQNRNNEPAPSPLKPLRIERRSPSPDHPTPPDAPTQVTSESTLSRLREAKKRSQERQRDEEGG